MAMPPIDFDSRREQALRNFFGRSAYYIGLNAIVTLRHIQTGQAPANTLGDPSLCVLVDAIKRLSQAFERQAYAVDASGNAGWNQLVPFDPISALTALHRLDQLVAAPFDHQAYQHDPRGTLTDYLLRVAIALDEARSWLTSVMRDPLVERDDGWWERLTNFCLWLEQYVDCTIAGVGRPGVMH